MKIQGAAISLGGVDFVIAIVDMNLVTAHGEADMSIDSLSAGFGGIPIILMAQKEDGSPVYFGDGDLVRLLQDVPVEKMPWKEYSVAM
ncbi:MAG: hypothetical protein V3R56_01825 [Xanthomonadales bacterium]